MNDDLNTTTLDDQSGPSGAGLIVDRQIERELHDSYLTYALSTILDRALPDVRDGLKPSQRRILVAMNDLNLSPRAKHRKCAKIAGDTSGNYHPHGESVIYPTLV
ncbi:MAG: DNA gyrase subunit A, partial [Phycisphaerales bacterium]